MPDKLLDMIWTSLGDGRLSTADLAARLESYFRYRCPDDLIRTMNKYRREGLVKGKVSFEDGGWIWWADEECRSRGV